MSFCHCSLAPGPWRAVTGPWLMGIPLLGPDPWPLTRLLGVVAVQTRRKARRLENQALLLNGKLALILVKLLL